MVIDPSLPEAVRLFLRALGNPCTLPFARDLWSCSLPGYIARIDEPTLAVIGKKDLQIDWRTDRGGFGGDCPEEHAPFAYPEDASRVLKHEGMPLEKLTAEYVRAHRNAPDAELDQGTAIQSSTG
jgi:uncharacterized protein